jgi:hypothetical protein
VRLRRYGEGERLRARALYPGQISTGRAWAVGRGESAPFLSEAPSSPKTLLESLIAVCVG